MSSIKFTFDTREFEKQLNEVINNKQKELIIKNRKDNNMFILNTNEETMLKTFLNKYNENKKYDITGNYNDFPDYMQFSIKDTMNTLKLYGLISFFDLFMSGGWHVILTPDALKYFEKKGSRIELFDELAKSDKDLLREIIEADQEDKNISELLKNKIENDKKDYIRGTIGNLENNGLIKVLWADETVYNALLIQQGRTFFEREKEYKKNISASSTYINAQNSTIFMGDVINSDININNYASKIENDIEEKCDNEEDKKVMKELLEEAKEIIENYRETNKFQKRKGFFKKLTEHLNKYGWFYAEITNLLGQTVLMKISGQI